MDALPWLAVTEGKALRFFFEHLRDVSDDHDAPEPELLYNASVLAHFATTSTLTSGEFLATPTSLHKVFDLFVLDRSHHVDPKILETAANQCLLLTGFFGAQLRGRHNVDWYAELGASFFDQAAVSSSDKPRSKMMHKMAVRFAFWRHQQARLAKELHDFPLMINTGVMREWEMP